MVNAAEELKYIGGIRRIIAAEVKDPSEEWVRFFVNRIYEGRTTQKVVDQFRPLVAKALNQYVGDQVNSRLKTALGDDAPDPNRSTEIVQSNAAPQSPIGQAAIAEAVVATADGVTDPGVVTTDEELEGFNIVRAIAVSEVAPERVHYRDSKSYFAILLDDNNRKPIIRLNLNGKSVKFVTTFEHGKDAGVRRDITSVVDIYKVATDEIRQTIRRYETGGAGAELNGQPSEPLRAVPEKPMPPQP
ncbi:MULTISPECIES: hypothetical protein [Mycolicibacterium]|uniref:hypothetical protein n=1 Tax=Mycolicibacterium TaxID=1866885 RepID=UPI001A9801C9|nr:MULTISPECIES: hypothetical protein [Mycolicibacterium]